MAQKCVGVLEHGISVCVQRFFRHCQNIGGRFREVRCTLTYHRVLGFHQVKRGIAGFAKLLHLKSTRTKNREWLLDHHADTGRP